jgi:catechol 2,3-dioxygenase-like lactoylglutathione lyase family enzyme
MINIFKRTTLVVRDVERSRKFYEEVMGLSVWYDRELALSGQGVPGEPGDKVRLVIMKAEDPTIGMVGLLQYTDPPRPAPSEPRSGLGIGDIVFVVQTDDASELYRRLQAWGALMHAPPHRMELPGADGQTVRMTSVTFYDPDGYFVEANQRH